MNEKELYLYRVKHPEHGETKVEAPDRLHAVVAAAKAYGVTRWTSIARECACEKLEPAPKKTEPKKRAPARKPKKEALAHD